jgi:DNA polymerase/3'-5' exonuclease PolX
MASPPTKVGGREAPNADLADKFLKVAKYYEVKGDLHRPGALRKASRLIRKFSTKITKENLDEVGVSKRIAERITQYLETGNMPELAAESKVEKKKSSELIELTTVFGIGLKTAEKLQAQGIKDLNDLKKKVKSGKISLTNSQMVGINYYQDFKERVPRREVSRFGDCILRAYIKLN